MMFRLIILTLIFFTDMTAYADASFPEHSGDSPWSFTVVAEPSDTFVVNDTDSATIDTVLFSKDGSIYIDVPIRRYVGKTSASGYLLNANSLIANGIVSEKVTILMPAYDIDDQPYLDQFDCDGDNIADENLTHEVDEVFLNDKKIGILKGESLAWNLNTFDVDISKIKFPSAPGETAINQFRIDVDVANQDVVLSSGAIGCGNGWSTSIDWIGILYQAASPVILVHGINSKGSAFADFQAGLDISYVVSDASIELQDLPTPEPIPAGCPDIPYNNSIDWNVRLLQQKIPQIAQLYGTDSIHLITHSKGGLDSRGYLSSIADSPPEIPLGTMGGVPVKSELKVLSLVTLNTPHQGSVLSEYGVEARQLSELQATLAGLTTFYAAKKQEGAYYCDLTPARASEFIASTKLPGGIQTASVATDADINGDQQITDPLVGDDESAGYPPIPIASNYAADTLYQLTGSVAHVTVSVSVDDKVTITTIPTYAFKPNDTIVTQSSASLYPTYLITGWNHLNVHSAQNAKTIATDALQEEGAGMVNWRLR
jgi:hypothetical protein